MADTTLFKRLSRLFSTNVVIRNVGGRLKVADTERMQSFSDLSTNFMKARGLAYFHSTAARYGYDLMANISTQRITIFRDYELMETDPIIASALDICSDSCTVKNEFGDILIIKSDNEKVKNILHNLFYDILNVEFNAWPWIRNLCKYGDMFLKLEISEKYGIINVIPISPYEIQREEGFDQENPFKVRFNLQGISGGKDALQQYEIAHFRLLSDTNFLPYGKSYIEPARRVWKQLQLLEDAMLIHRIMRAPEKRIFKIDTGNMPPADVETYVRNMVNKIKKVPYVDPTTGDYNLKFNMMNMTEDFFIPVRGGDSGTSIDTLPGLEYNAIEDVEYLRDKMLAALKVPRAFLGYEEGLCLRKNTSIPLLNGKTKTVEELINDYNNGIINYVYSIDENTQNIVPGEIEWAGYTRKNAEMVRVWLDNNEYIDCTPDHNFMTRDCKWVEAKDLQPDDSLMPFYKRNKIMYGKSDYEQIYNPSTGKWEWTHKRIDEHTHGKLIQPYIKNGDKFNINELVIVHHDNFSRFDNTPPNLKRLLFKDHRNIHSTHAEMTFCSKAAIAYKKSDEFRKKKSLERIKYITNNPEEKERLKKNLAQYKFTNDELSILTRDAWKKDDGKRRKKLIEDNKKFNKVKLMQKILRKKKGFNDPLPSFIDLVNFSEKNGYSTKQSATSLGCGRNYIHKLILQNGYDSIGDFSAKYNLITFENVIDSAKTSKSFNDIRKKLHVGYKKLYNILYNNGIMNETDFIDEYMPLFIHNNNKDNVKIYKNHKVIKVEHLSEKEDTCDIRVKIYHNFAVSAGVIVHNSGKASLAQEDVRFSYMIERIQRIFVSELYKIAIVHLVVQGLNDEEIIDFSLELTNPSTIHEQEKISMWQEKVSLIRDMKETKMFGEDWIYKNVVNLTEEDIKNQKLEVITDAKKLFRLTQIEGEGNDPFVTKQTFGTPHDLAMMQQKSKEIAGEFSEKKLDFGDNNFKLDYSAHEDGDVETSVGGYHKEKERDPEDDYGEQNHVRGKDPLGGDGFAGAHKRDTIRKPKFRGGSPLSLDSVDMLKNKYGIKQLKDDLMNKQTKSRNIISESLRTDEEILKDEESKTEHSDDGTLLDEGNLLDL